MPPLSAPFTGLWFLARSFRAGRSSDTPSVVPPMRRHRVRRGFVRMAVTVPVVAVMLDRLEAHLGGRQPPSALEPAAEQRDEGQRRAGTELPPEIRQREAQAVARSREHP